MLNPPRLAATRSFDAERVRRARAAGADPVRSWLAIDGERTVENLARNMFHMLKHGAFVKS